METCHFDRVPHVVVDQIFKNLNPEDLNETLQVSKSWFTASVRRIRTLLISKGSNFLKTAADHFNKNTDSDPKIKWHELLQLVVLDELVVQDSSSLNQLRNNGCRTRKLVIDCRRRLPLSPSKIPDRFLMIESVEMALNGAKSLIGPQLEHLETALDICREFKKLTRIRWTIPKESCKGGVPAECVTALSVTSVQNISAFREFLRLFPNLEELEIGGGVLSPGWRYVFPSNLKNIRLLNMDHDHEIHEEIEFWRNVGRQLLPYVCKYWQVVEYFKVSEVLGNVYEAYPQTREECIDANLTGYTFPENGWSCKSFATKVWSFSALERKVPPAKSVNISIHNMNREEFSPYFVCSDPTQWENLTLKLQRFIRIQQGSFEGMKRLLFLSLYAHSADAETLTTVLTSCPNLEKLELAKAEDNAVDRIAVYLHFPNLKELIITESVQSIDRIIEVFPNLEKLESKENTFSFPDVCHRLNGIHKKYGAVFSLSVKHMVFLSSDSLQVTLERAQSYLRDYKDCECYLKGFKQTPRYKQQKIFFKFVWEVGMSTRRRTYWKRIFSETRSL